MKIQRYYWALLTLIGFSFCNSIAKPGPADSKSESGKSIQIKYDLSSPVQSWDLPGELKEVSGNAWVDQNHLLMIEDMHPILYLMKLDGGKASIEKQIPFQQSSNKKFDIEDVTVSGNTAFAIWSHGIIYQIDNWRSQPKVTELATDLDKANNTEGIAADPVSGNLLIACKNESGLDDEKKSSRAVYEYKMSKGKLRKDPFLIIEKSEFKKLAGEKLDFFPSAIAVHPVTHDIYLLSTRENKIMVQ